MTTEAVLAQAKALLKDARTILRTEGWTQKTSRDMNGNQCLAAALASAKVRGNYDHKASYEAVALLRRHLKTGPVEWNDTPGRTKQEVLDMLEAVTS